ncbi:MAG: xanthine dehydrogenase accessory protein XdhC [Betaproteobacteria bacterium]|nr:xanthine dehydrogenase accessory protein XdhC [Betaproteobacteria bacterium]
MTDWVTHLGELTLRGQDCVLVTVAAVRGSAPREPGARMIVTRAAAVDTIGGGTLEAACVDRARQMLATGDPAAVQLVRFPLDAGFGQCCGGVATILFEHVAANRAEWLPVAEERVRSGEAAALVTGAEGRGSGAKLVVGLDMHSGTLSDAGLDRAAIARARALLAGEEGAWTPRLQRLEAGDASGVVFIEPLRPCDLEVVLFGAGHVGRALVKTLGEIDCHVTWVDSRAGEFPPAAPANTRIVVTDALEREVDRAPAGACVLVMTHSHQLDFELCERALRRADLAYVGLIGSAPKRARFLKSLKLEGIPEASLARLTCPIGVPGISSKRPAAIALSAAAQILQVHEASMAERERTAGRGTDADVHPRAKHG